MMFTIYQHISRKTIWTMVTHLWLKSASNPRKFQMFRRALFYSRVRTCKLCKDPWTVSSQTYLFMAKYDFFITKKYLLLNQSREISLKLLKFAYKWHRNFGSFWNWLETVHESLQRLHVFRRTLVTTSVLYQLVLVLGVQSILITNTSHAHRILPA